MEKGMKWLKCAIYDDNYIAVSHEFVSIQSTRKEILTQKSLRVPPVVWTYDTSDDNFGIRNDFSKLVKEICWYSSE